MRTTAITFTSHTGGQGRTLAACVAALVAADHGSTMLITDNDDALATLGVGTFGPGAVTDVSDGLRVAITDGTEDALALAALAGLSENCQPAYVVTDLRNTPDADALAFVGFDVVPVVVVRRHYVALRRVTLATDRDERAHVVTFDEPGRVLSVRDLDMVLRVQGLTLTAPYSENVGRIVDAGLLLTTVHRDVFAYREALADLFTPSAVVAKWGDASKVRAK
jgi:hypothetical protein